MIQNDFTNFFDPEFFKGFTGFNGFNVDMKTVMETQRRNFQAMTEAQQRAIEGMQELSQRQGEIISQIMEDNSAIAQEIMGEGSPEQKVAKQADLMKKVYEKQIGHMKEMAVMMNKSGEQTSDIINKRVCASLAEIKSALEKSGKKPAAAAKKAA